MACMRVGSFVRLHAIPLPVVTAVKGAVSGTRCAALAHLPSDPLAACGGRIRWQGEGVSRLAHTPEQRVDVGGNGGVCGRSGDLLPVSSCAEANPTAGRKSIAPSDRSKLWGVQARHGESDADVCTRSVIHSGTPIARREKQATVSQTGTNRTLHHKTRIHKRERCVIQIRR